METKSKNFTLKLYIYIRLHITYTIQYTLTKFTYRKEIKINILMNEKNVKTYVLSKTRPF